MTYQVIQPISGSLPMAPTTVPANVFFLSNDQKFFAGEFLDNLNGTCPVLARGQRLVVYVARTGSPLFANPATPELIDALTVIGALHHAGNPPAQLAREVDADNARIAIYSLQKLLQELGAGRRRSRYSGTYPPADD